MFKKREKPIKKVDLVKETQQDQIELQPQQQLKQEKEEEPRNKVILQSKKINKFSMKDALTNVKQQIANQKFHTALPQKPEVKFGLIEKEAQSTNIEIDAVMDLYIKDKMKAKLHQEVPKEAVHLNTKEEVMKMQKKYLQPIQSKTSMYDIATLQKKLESMATDLLKTQKQKRVEYLKNLLQNELERMEYASKAELKHLKQQRERDEKYLEANYMGHGRRHFMNRTKKEVLEEKYKGE